MSEQGARSSNATVAVRLQSFKHEDSPYERPNQRWRCAYASQAQRCKMGPDKYGHCGGESACLPRRNGGRWNCSRGAEAGGPCTDGPLPDGGCSVAVIPCIPVHSWRSRRAQLVRWAFAIALGALVLGVSGAGLETWLSPGPISAAHRAIGECSDCHQAFSEGPRAWLHAALQDGPDFGDSERCLSCHTVGPDAGRPHTVAADQLSGTAPARAGDSVPVALSLQAFALPTDERHNDSIECSTCHKEHHGLALNLNTVSDFQCQTCHERKFGGFSEGHPPLGRYPYSQRTHIIFDHERHFSRHFPEAAQAGQVAPESCHSCHSLGVDGKLMAARSFAHTCAGCHTGDLDGELASGIKGIPFFSLPGLDTDTLHDSEFEVGDWPEHAEAGLLGLLPLLAGAGGADGKVAAQLEGLDGLDLSDASLDQRRAAQIWALAIKDFLHRYQSAGAQTFVAQIKSLTGDNLQTTQLANLGALIPRDVIDATVADWFPRLSVEMARHYRGEPLKSLDEVSAGDGREATNASVLAERDNDPSVSGEGEGAQDILSLTAGVGSGDSILAGLPASQSDTDGLSRTSDGNILGSDSGAAQKDSILGELSEQSTAADILNAPTTEGAGDSILAGASDSQSDTDGLSGTSDGNILGSDSGAAQKDSILGGLSDQITGTDILNTPASGGSGDGILGGLTDEGGSQGRLTETRSTADDGILSSSTATTGGLAASGDSLVLSSAGAKDADENDPPTLVEADAWAHYGGWFREGATLYYRPAGHADPVLKAWLGVLTSLENSRPWAGAVLDTLRASEYPGRCTKCHSTEQTADGGQVIHWRPRVGVNSPSRLTVFSHKTHFPMLSQEGCVTCHQLNPDPGDSYLASYKHADATQAVSNFSPIKAETCSNCHVPEMAGDRCTTCHRYHPEGSVVTQIKGALPTSDAAQSSANAIR